MRFLGRMFFCSGGGAGGHVGGEPPKCAKCGGRCLSSRLCPARAPARWRGTHASAADGAAQRRGGAGATWGRRACDRRVGHHGERTTRISSPCCAINCPTLPNEVKYKCIYISISSFYHTLLYIFLICTHYDGAIRRRSGI
jgi:hypothetical protein